MTAFLGAAFATTPVIVVGSPGKIGSGLAVQEKANGAGGAIAPKRQTTPALNRPEFGKLLFCDGFVVDVIV